MEYALPEQLFRKFSRLIYETSGIHLHVGKKELLQARLNRRLRATGIASYKDYYDHITSGVSNGEMVHFINSISTNLTYFFREERHFHYLDNKAVPEMLARKKKERNRRIRVWSAGCSSGEEPYSIAMCILSHLSVAQEWDFKILATDISTRMLDTAVQGIYEAKSMEKVPRHYRGSFFVERRQGDGRILYEAAPLLKKTVTFRWLNLKEEPYPFKGPFDFIFCRNVMIYFDRPTQQNLIRRMAAYLCDGGYLFVGHSESLTGLNHPLRYVEPSVYLK